VVLAVTDIKEESQLTDTADTTTPKRMHPNKLRDILYALALDWYQLHTQLPTPPHHATTRRTPTRTYGHPAEWASNKAAEIAAILHSWHDLLAEHRHETPPPGGSEQTRVVAAWRYLEPRCEHLTQLVTEDDLKELPDLHHQIRNTLGYTQPRYTLPVPCPAPDCGLRTLTRRVGIGHDLIICDHCGYTVLDDEHGHNYRWLVRVCLDTLIGD